MAREPVISDVTLSDAKKLEVANGTLQSSNVALAGNSNLAVSGGVLRMAENGVLSFADTAHLTLRVVLPTSTRIWCSTTVTIR